MSEADAVGFVAARGDRLRPIAGLLRRPVAEPLWEAVAIAVICPIVLAAAFWNGFPLIFYDTGAYIFQGFTDRFVAERSPIYSLFVRYGGGGISLWFVAILQVIATSFVIVQMARAIVPRMPFATILAIASGLTLLTSLPWFADQIEPDCFTALLVLSLYLLTFHSKAEGGWRCAVLVAIAALGIASHPSHLGLALGLVLLAVIYALVAARFKSFDWPRANPVLPLVGTVLALVMTLVANYHYTRHVFFTRAGGVFVMARMMQDGIVKPVLDETCPLRHFALCTYRDSLPRRADQYLWGPQTPFNKLGRFLGTEKESAQIVRESLKRRPWLNLEMAARDSVEQFAIFHTGDGIDPQQWIIGRDFHIFMPAQFVAYDDALQQKGRIPFRAINFVHLPVAWIALALLIGGLIYTVRLRQGGAATLFGFVLAALIGNAIICGALSGPHARYQSRLMWTPVLALALVGSGRLPLRGR